MNELADTRDLHLAARGCWTVEGRPAVPNVVQQWVMDAALSEDTQEVFVLGGFGSGKTSLLAWTIWRAICAATSLWDGRRASRPRIALASSDGAQLRTVTWPALAAQLNSAVGHDGPFWAPHRRRISNPLVLGYDADDHTYDLRSCRITLATGQTGCEALEGGSYCIIGGDEAPLWLPVGLTRTRARLRQMGYPRLLLHVATPQPGRALPQIAERYRHLSPYIPVYEHDEGGRYGRVRVGLPTRLNLEHLPPGYISQLRSGVSPQMARAYLDGELVIMQGLVYSSFGAANLVDAPRSGWPDRRMYVGWDPGYRRPYLALVQPSPDHGERAHVVVDELALHDTSVEGQAQALLRAQAMRGRRHITIVPDPAGRSTQSTSGRSDIATMRDHLQRAGVTSDVIMTTSPDLRVITARCERLRMWIEAADGTRSLLLGRHLADRRYHRGHDGMPTAGLYQSLTEQPLRRGSDEPDRSPQWDHLSHPADTGGYLALALGGVRLASHRVYERHAQRQAEQRGQVRQLQAVERRRGR